MSTTEPTTATLTLETLHIVSDELAQNFDQQMAIAVADCRQRPSQTDKRTVTIKVAIQPHPDDPDDVLIEPVTTLHVPSRKIDSLRARRTRADQLQFDFVAVSEDD